MKMIHIKIKKKIIKKNNGEEMTKKCILPLNFNFDHNLPVASCLAYVSAFNNLALGLNN